jgi:FkbM family methyltransferase
MGDIGMIEWRKVWVYKMHDNPPASEQWKWWILLPDWMAVNDIYAAWEVERFLSMEKHLKQTDVLFDIGTENAWQTMVYGKFVNPVNIVLIEPSEEYWPNIKTLWRKNFTNLEPLACYAGLFSNKTTSKVTLPKHAFPLESDGNLTTLMTYKYIHEHGNEVAQIKIDDYVKETGITPTALTMDTEGAELPILKGATKTLKANDLKVWVSVHPELGKKNYNYTKKDLMTFMKKCGYSGEFLATDHEEHWYFTKDKK